MRVQIRIEIVKSKLQKHEKATKLCSTAWSTPHRHSERGSVRPHAQCPEDGSSYLSSSRRPTAPKKKQSHHIAVLTTLHPCRSTVQTRKHKTQANWTRNSLQSTPTYQSVGQWPQQQWQQNRVQMEFSSRDFSVWHARSKTVHWVECIKLPKQTGHTSHSAATGMSLFEKFQPWLITYLLFDRMMRVTCNYTKKLCAFCTPTGSESHFAYKCHTLPLAPLTKDRRKNLFGAYLQSREKILSMRRNIHSIPYYRQISKEIAMWKNDIRCRHIWLLLLLFWIGNDRRTLCEYEVWTLDTRRWFSMGHGVCECACPVYMSSSHDTAADDGDWKIKKQNKNELNCATKNVKVVKIKFIHIIVRSGILGERANSVQLVHTLLRIILRYSSSIKNGMKNKPIYLLCSRMHGMRLAIVPCGTARGEMKEKRRKK